MSDLNDTLLATRRVCDRYGISDKTVGRWIRDPRLAFPRPVVINRRLYFRESELVAWERSHATIGCR